MNKEEQYLIQRIIWRGYYRTCDDALLSPMQRKRLVHICNLSELKKIKDIETENNLNQNIKITLSKIRRLYKVPNNISLLKLILLKITNEDIIKIVSEHTLKKVI